MPGISQATCVMTSHTKETKEWIARASQGQSGFGFCSSGDITVVAAVKDAAMSLSHHARGNGMLVVKIANHSRRPRQYTFRIEELDGRVVWQDSELAANGSFSTRVQATHGTGAFSERVHSFSFEVKNTGVATIRISAVQSNLEAMIDFTAELDPNSPIISVGRLPRCGNQFVGREKELELLEQAWGDASVNMVQLVGFGGVGKSALVAGWLRNMAASGWRGAARVFGYSFYSQGTRDFVASADQFLTAALNFFSDPDPSVGSSQDKGARLARLIQGQQTLLILDGVEPLQEPPSSNRAGALRDAGLSALLRELVADNNGLCVVSTRQPIEYIEQSGSATVQKIEIGQLSPSQGMLLLKRLGVQGEDEQLASAASELGGHSLAITLLGNYLSRAFDGDINRMRDVDLSRSDLVGGGHFRRILAAYEKWFGEGPEFSILRLIGFFDGPADAASIAALRRPPVIPYVTESIVGLDDPRWNTAVQNLRSCDLLLGVNANSPDSLDAHPIIRDAMRREIQAQNPITWSIAMQRLGRPEGGEIAGPLSLYVDVGRYSPEQVAQIIQTLSDMFEVMSGDRLVIDGQGLIEPSENFEPVEN